MHPARQLSVTQITEIVEAYRNGASLDMLRARYQAGRRVIRRVLIQAGVAITGQGHKLGKSRALRVQDGVECLYCPRCRKWVPRDNFSNNKRSPSGKASYCKPCQTTYAKFRLYGITPEAYNKLLAQQNGGCAICGEAGAASTRSPLMVDHDHQTGQLRALLCHRCNSAIGLLREDLDLMRRAMRYIQQHRTP